jgi:CRP-like cAMP-binding protein
LRAPRRARPERASAVVTRSELAALVNVSRPTLVPILKRFESEGLIEQGYRTIRICDAAKLQALALRDHAEAK